MLCPTIRCSRWYRVNHMIQSKNPQLCGTAAELKRYASERRSEMHLRLIGLTVLALMTVQLTSAKERWGNGQTIVKETTYSASPIKLATYCQGDPVTAKWILATYHTFPEG